MKKTELDKFYAEMGRRIKNERNKKNLSQEDLATVVNLTRTSITNIEKGRQKPLAHTLWDIARKLSIDINSLFPSVDEPYKDVLKELPEAHQRAIKAALEGEGGDSVL